MYNGLYPFVFRAAVAELVDALASGASECKLVEVQVLFAAPKTGGLFVFIRELI